MSGIQVGGGKCPRVAVAVEAGFQGTWLLCSVTSCSSSQLRAISSRSPVPGVWMASVIWFLVLFQARPSQACDWHPVTLSSALVPAAGQFWWPGHRLDSHQGAPGSAAGVAGSESWSFCLSPPPPRKVQDPKAPFKHFPS